IKRLQIVIVKVVSENYAFLHRRLLDGFKERTAQPTTPSRYNKLCSALRSFSHELRQSADQHRQILARLERADRQQKIVSNSQPASRVRGLSKRQRLKTSACRFRNGEDLTRIRFQKLAYVHTHAFAGCDEDIRSARHKWQTTPSAPDAPLFVSFRMKQLR